MVQTEPWQVPAGAPCAGDEHLLVQASDTEPHPTHVLGPGAQKADAAHWSEEVQLPEKQVLVAGSQAKSWQSADTVPWQTPPEQCPVITLESSQAVQARLSVPVWRTQPPFEHT